MVRPILDGIKTETRRVWKRCMVREGHVYKARTRYSRDGIFALIRIMYVKREKLGDIDTLAAMREGYATVDEFIKCWVNLYGSWDPDLYVYVIGFRLQSN